MMTPLNKQIIELRKKGLTFSQIAKKLKCAKSTVSYALRKKTRNLAKEKSKNYPKKHKAILNKIYTFQNPKPLSKQSKPAWYLNKSKDRQPKQYLIKPIVSKDL